MRARMMVTVPIVAGLSLLGTGLGLSVAATPAAAAEVSCATVDHDVLTVLSVPGTLKPVAVAVGSSLLVLNGPAVTTVLDLVGLGHRNDFIVVQLSKFVPGEFRDATTAETANEVGAVLKVEGLCS